MRLKASWEVHAGICPGEAREQFSRRWEYLSEDHTEDSEMKEPHQHAKFSKMRAEVMDYYLQISQPFMNNWATVQFVWY